MDFKKLIPDFNVIAKTDWAKPHINPQNAKWLALVGPALLMVVFVFLSWQTTAITNGRNLIAPEVTASGITMWYGIMGLIFTIVAIFGILYKHLQFVFCGSVLAALMGIIGWTTTQDTTFVRRGHAFIETASELNVREAFGTATISHTGAMLFFFASVALAVISFVLIKNENE
jgi:hypothetical protein